MLKKELRKQILKRMEKIPPEDLEKKSQSACDRLCNTEEFKQASVVMLFLSLPHEVDTSHVILHAFQQDKTVLVPCIDWDNRHLFPVKIHSLDCDMSHDRHGLRYPAKGEPMPIDEIDFIVAPGVGFDHQGNRLGRGGGFYDRFLAHDGFKGRVCGLTIEEQVVESMPVTDNDVPIDMLVTDRCIRRFDNAGRKIKRAR
ncbi:MAG: 5-formyltetrahydrofolate cyclo-ligase [Sedimentisphaerales bacterium]|nr:5-formyltetrahydrofolate cyclo-ligase [Sedimentisphaerales bacterium]